MTIPLHSKIMEILKIYDGNFPRKISDQKYNEHIKCLWKAKNKWTQRCFIWQRQKEKIEQDYQNGNLFLLTLEDVLCFK
jgi:hypothetical protein